MKRGWTVELMAFTAQRLDFCNEKTPLFHHSLQQILK